MQILGVSVYNRVYRKYLQYCGYCQLLCTSCSQTLQHYGYCELLCTPCSQTLQHCGHSWVIVHTRELNSAALLTQLLHCSHLEVKLHHCGHCKLLRSTYNQTAALLTLLSNCSHQAVTFCSIADFAIYCVHNVVKLCSIFDTAESLFTQTNSTTLRLLLLWTHCNKTLQHFCHCWVIVHTLGIQTQQHCVYHVVKLCSIVDPSDSLFTSQSQTLQQCRHSRVKLCSVVPTY